MITAFAQMKMSENINDNYEKSLEYIKTAAENGAELICFPEIQLTPFFPQYKGRDIPDFLLTPEHPYIRGICDACAKYGIYAAPNFYIKENGKNYDMSLLIDDNGKIIGRQKMVHIAQCKNFYEQDYYTPSDDGFAVFDTEIGKIGIVVCFDRHYPESIRTEALMGAELIIIPTANTTAEPSDMFLWEIKVQAFQNSVNIAMCNRTGTEDKMTFSGESAAIDCNGNTIMLADDTEGLFFADIDMGKTADARNSKPYTSLRRTEFYK